jgi:hypothetical protein
MFMRRNSYGSLPTRNARSSIACSDTNAIDRSSGERSQPARKYFAVDKR